MKEIVLTGDAAEVAQNAVKRAREMFPMLRELEDDEILLALVYIGMKIDETA